MASSIEFKLFAPNNKGAFLLGSFSNWKDILMKKGKDGYFRTSVELEDGVHQYKFRVQTKSPNFEPDQWVEVIDPYATDVDEAKSNSLVSVRWSSSSFTKTLIAKFWHMFAGVTKMSV